MSWWSGLFGMSGEEIYRNFTEAPGAGELAAAADIVRGVQAEHEDEAASVRALAVRMESAWQGEAAGAAQRGAVPLAAEHEWGAPLFFTAQDLTARQVGSFDDARHGVVPVPPAPDKPSGWEIITSPTTLPTYERRFAEHNAAAQHNVDLMTGYEGASSFNGDNLPTSYGSIAPDSAGIAVQSQDNNAQPDGGDRVDGPSSPLPNGPRGDGGGQGGPEWQPTGDPSGGPDPAAPPSSGGQGGQPSQETTPGGYVPPKPPPGQGPVGPNVPGSGAPSGSGGGEGLVGVPPVGFPPGGPGSGTRGPAGGFGGGPDGGRGVPGGGRPGPGPGGEAGHGQGGRAGVGPPAGGAAAEAAARGGAGARGGGAGGVPMGMGAGRGRGGEDEERERPSWLIQPEDPEDTFGTAEVTAPPVIGHEDEDDQ